MEHGSKTFKETFQNFLGNVCSRLFSPDSGKHITLCLSPINFGGNEANTYVLSRKRYFPALGPVSSLQCTLRIPVSKSIEALFLICMCLTVAHRGSDQVMAPIVLGTELLIVRGSLNYKEQLVTIRDAQKWGHFS